MVFNSTNVNGWEGSPAAIWNSFQNFDSYDGNQHAELNADYNQGQMFSIFQSFATVSGTAYDASFAYAARTGDNEQFSYDINDGTTSIDSVLFNNDLVTQWTFFKQASLRTVHKVPSL